MAIAGEKLQLSATLDNRHILSILAKAASPVYKGFCHLPAAELSTK
jgi:hypothetical protein